MKLESPRWRHGTFLTWEKFLLKPRAFSKVAQPSCFNYLDISWFLFHSLFLPSKTSASKTKAITSLLSRGLQIRWAHNGLASWFRFLPVSNKFKSYLRELFYFSFLSNQIHCLWSRLVQMYSPQWSALYELLSQKLSNLLKNHLILF